MDRLSRYMLRVCLAAAPMTAFAVARIDLDWFRGREVSFVALLAVLVVGELMPIPVARRDDAGDEISISSTIACAMVLLAPVGVVIVAQALALAADEALKRRNWGRLAFNVAQYSIALLAMKVTFALMVGGSVFDAHALRPDDLLAALVSAAPFFLVNNGLTGTAVALKLRVSVWRQLVSDFRWQLLTAGVLLALSPVLAESFEWSPWTLPLLLLPLGAVHRSAKLAFAREREALHDALTRLPNRTLLNSRLHAACHELARRPVAVMLLDLDHFKDINDTLGHHVGDRVIAEVAERLRKALRAQDLIARLGGDEFAVLAYGVPDAVTATAQAERLLDALREPLLVDGTQLETRCSIGIALGPAHGLTAELLTRQADVALYAAKERRGTIAVYQADRDESSLERLSLVNDLRHAVENDDIFVVYQPQCESATGTVVALEALVRWRHPVHGLLSPDAFIALAENAGLIDQITTRVLGDALAKLRDWCDNGWPLSLAVNVSPRGFDNELPRQLAGLLSRYGVPASLLTLELTESTIMTDTISSLGLLRRLRDLGVRLSIDDFGTGYSSLSYLKRLQVDEVKIDRAFIAGLAHDDNDAAIVRAAIDLGHHFGLRVVAEGVEDATSWARLSSMGADVVQGYHISRPLPAAEIDEWLSHQFAPALAGHDLSRAG
ncbi:MAG: putative bifunctional diguanylate cyclase/phosphodiesterase [Frankiaceae bacterium]